MMPVFRMAFPPLEPPGIGDNGEHDDESEPQSDQQSRFGLPHFLETRYERCPDHVTTYTRISAPSLNHCKKNAAPLGAAVIATLNHIAMPL